VYVDVKVNMMLSAVMYKDAGDFRDLCVHNYTRPLAIKPIRYSGYGRDMGYTAYIRGFRFKDVFNQVMKRGIVWK